MLRTYIVWGLFIIVTIYLIKELFSNNKENPEEEEEEIETPEEKELAEIALNAKPIDESDDNQANKSFNDKDSPEPEKKLIRIFMASSQVQSRMIEMKLHEEGIQSVIEPIGAGIFPLDTESSCEEAILVDEKDVAKAQQIIMEHVEEEKNQSKQTQIILPQKNKNQSSSSEPQKPKNSDKKKLL